MRSGRLRVVNFAPGDRVYVQITTKYHPERPLDAIERTEIPATVESIMTGGDDKPLVVVTIDEQPDPRRKGERRDGYGFPPDLVRLLNGIPRSICVYEERVRLLEAAIRRHRDTRGHDRCFEHDQDLYRLLPDFTGPINPGLPSKEEFMGGCSRYYDEQSRTRKK